jgi:hypothetical protein
MSGNSTDSNSPEIKIIKAPKKFPLKVSGQATFKNLKIMRCPPVHKKSKSPFQDDRLINQGMGDSRRLSNYKRDMESLFKEVDNKDRLNLAQNL